MLPPCTYFSSPMFGHQLHQQMTHQQMTLCRRNWAELLHDIFAWEQTHELKLLKLQMTVCKRLCGPQHYQE